VRRPLVHIGYHKTGTSWLQRNLFRSAELGFNTSGKGAGTPVTTLVATRALDFDAERARQEFEGAFVAAGKRDLVPVVSLERLSGHPFSGGYDNRELAERLAAVLPGARVLCVFREQTAMIASTYKQFVKTGGGSSLERFLDPPVHRHMRIPLFDLRHFEYDRLLALYRKLFGAEAVLFLPYELFASEPHTFVERIVEFAGANASSAAIPDLPFDARPNLAHSAVATGLVRRVNRLLALADVNPTPLVAADPLLVKRIRRSLVKTVDSLPRGLLDREERRLRDRISSFVADRYGASNERLAQLTGEDLAAYGYVTTNAESHVADRSH
jgi:Sulfotransferase family